MKHPERVEDYLEHIVEAIDRVAGYLRDTATFDAFQQDRTAVQGLRVGKFYTLQSCLGRFPRR